MLLLATDLNGHLRVHPKRVAFMPHPESVPPKESLLASKNMQIMEVFLLEKIKILPAEIIKIIQILPAERNRVGEISYDTYDHWN